MAFHLFADRQLALEVSHLLFLYLAMLTSLMFEEVITCFLKFLEDLFTELLRYSPDLLALGLQRLQLGGSRVPLRAVLKLSRTRYQLILEPEVVLAFFVELLDQGILVAEELVQC